MVEERRRGGKVVKRKSKKKGRSSNRETKTAKHEKPRNQKQMKG